MRKHGYLVKANGKADLSREVLERNILDFLTFKMDMEDAVAIVDEMTIEDMKIFAVKYLADDSEPSSCE